MGGGEAARAAVESLCTAESNYGEFGFSYVVGASSLCACVCVGLRERGFLG